MFYLLLQFADHCLLSGNCNLQISVPAAQLINQLLLFSLVPQSQIVGEAKQASHIGGFNLHKLTFRRVFFKNRIKNICIVQILRKS